MCRGWCSVPPGEESACPPALLEIRFPAVLIEGSLHKMPWGNLFWTFSAGNRAFLVKGMK